MGSKGTRRAESASNWRRDMAMDGTIAKLRVEGKTTLVPLLRPPLVVNWYSRGSIEYAFRFAELMVLYCERAARLNSDVKYLPPPTRLPIMLVNAPHKAASQPTELGHSVAWRLSDMWIASR